MHTNNVLIFEDHDVVPCSSLLREFSYNGSNIYFSRGNGKLYKEFKKHYNTTDTFYIVLDYVPNNRSLDGVYNGIYDRVHGSERYKGNVYIIPTVCMEYVIVRSLVKYSYITNTDLLLNSDCSNYNDIMLKHPEKKTLEKVFKVILDEQLSEEFHNVTGQGSFYLTGQRGYKAEQIYSCLPIAPIISEQHKSYVEFCNISGHSMDLNSINEFYKSLWEVAMPGTKFTCIAQRIKKG